MLMFYFFVMNCKINSHENNNYLFLNTICGKTDKFYFFMNFEIQNIIHKLKQTNIRTSIVQLNFSDNWTIPTIIVFLRAGY